MQRSGQNQEVKSIGHDHEFNIESSKGKGDEEIIDLKDMSFKSKCRPCLDAIQTNQLQK